MIVNGKTLFNAPWKITEYCSGTITVRTSKDFVCRCSGNDNGRKFAKRISHIPELYDGLFAHLSATCIRCKRRVGDFDVDEFRKNNGCSNPEEKGCLFRKHWKLLNDVLEGK